MFVCLVQLHMLTFKRLFSVYFIFCCCCVFFLTPPSFVLKLPLPYISSSHWSMTETRTPAMSSVPQTNPMHTDPPTTPVEMDPVEYTLRKRLPRKLPKRRNDVYVNMKTDFRAQLARCQKLLEGGGHREICVHGLGLAINRAINIALQLQASSQGALQLAANTSTVELVDDLEPEDPDDCGEPMTRTRNNSAIHIKVFYPDHQWLWLCVIYKPSIHHDVLVCFCSNNKPGSPVALLMYRPDELTVDFKVKPCFQN